MIRVTLELKNPVQRFELDEDIILRSGYVKIIQCKNCKHSVDYYNDGDCYCQSGHNGDSLTYIDGGWEHYCGYAERKEE